MNFKSILLPLVVCIATSRKCIVQSEFVDIVLQFNDSNQNNYTRFINVTQPQFVWLSSALCDNNTYSYSITYDRDNGSVVSYNSTTSMAQNVDPAIYRAEFTCTSTSTVFQCTRLLGTCTFDNNKISWIYRSTDLSSACPDTCVTMCPAYPIQSIALAYDAHSFKTPNNAECLNAKPDQTSLAKSQSTFTPTYSSPFSQENSIKTSHDSLPVIIGASVGGGALIIIVIILSLVCVRKRQNRTKLKNSQQKEHSCVNTKENGIKTKKQDNQGDQKTYITDLGKAKCIHQLTSSLEGAETFCNNNVNVNIATYYCVEKDAMEALEKDDTVSKFNTNKRQFQPSEFSNHAFNESGVDYSFINEVQNEINNNANSNDGIYTSEPFHNSGNTYTTLGQNTRSLLADTYSTLGEKTRSLSDTYNVMPTMSNKKGHKSLGAIYDYDNNRGNAFNENLGNNVGQMDGAPNDVYAQVIKPWRKVHCKE